MQRKSFLNIVTCAAIVVVYVVFMPIAVAKVSPALVEESVVIDGQLDETQWQQALLLNEFTVVQPDNGLQPKHLTESKVVYTNDGLFIGVVSYQPYDTQVERQSARDNFIERDHIQLVLDTSGEGLYGYIFIVGLGGSLIDGTVQPERQFSYDWNAPWQAKTSRFDNRWEAEIFIPWSALKLPEAVDKRTVGISIERRISYLAENWAVPALGENRPVFLSALMPMEFDHFEVEQGTTFIPYVSASADRLNDQQAYNAGIDFYYRPSSDSQISLTLNPDFGQVENDEIVVNFSAFETYSPEKRPFFLEGQEVFNSKGVMMVNTRRIGARPDSPTLTDGQLIENGPGYSDVLAAAKYTGQVGDMRVGVMAALEDDSEFTLNDGSKTNVDGRRYLVGRFLNEANTENDHYYAWGYLGTLTERPTYQASTHMFDSEFRSNDDKWQLNGQIYLSDVDGDNGLGYRTALSYSPSDGEMHEFWFSHFNEQLNLNDLGYLQRNDENRFHYNWHHPELGETVYFKMMDYGQWFDYRTNGAGERLNLRVGNWFYFQFADLTSFNFTTHYTTESWDDKNSRGNGSYRQDAVGHVWTRYQSDSSQALSYGLSAWMRNAQQQGIHFGVAPYVNYSPTTNLSFNLELGLNDNDNWQIWQQDNRIDTFSATQLFVTLKSNWIINNEQELRVALQWVGVEATGLHAYRIDEVGELVLSPEEQVSHFNQADLAFQVRYKYQFAPLSDLYLVYSRGGNTFDESTQEQRQFGQLFSDSLDETTADQLTFKLSYRF